MSKKHVIIVGAGPGIGLGCARAFGAAGFAVSLIASGKDSLVRATQTLTARGCTAASFLADAAEESCQ